MLILVDPGPPEEMERTSHVGLSVHYSSTSSVSTLTFNRTNKILNKKLETFSVCGYKNGVECLNTEIADTLNSETRVEGKRYRLSELGTERVVSHP